MASPGGHQGLRDEWAHEEGGREGGDDDLACDHYRHEEQEVAAIGVFFSAERLDLLVCVGSDACI